jgi:ribosomal protein S18 acetylase RimI-like enzyme
MITIEKAAENDIETICTLDSMSLSNPSRREFLVNAIKAGQSFVAKTQNTIVGFGILEQSFFGQCFISLLLVHPNYRKRGVATAIVKYIESICPTEKIFTSTNKSNVVAQRMFESLDFVKSGYIENLDEGDPEIIYFKRLRGKGV